MSTVQAASILTLIFWLEVIGLFVVVCYHKYNVNSVLYLRLIQVLYALVVKLGGFYMLIFSKNDKKALI